MAANWLVLNTGTVKEAYATILVLNLIGLIRFMVDGRRVAPREFRSAGLMLFVSGVSFAMITLPIVGTFLETLGKGATNDDAPTVQQLPIWQALILVDSYFSLLTSGEYVPAVNALLIAGFSGAILCIRNCHNNNIRNSTIVYTTSATIVFAITFAIVHLFGYL
jgi:hypothetical protein